MPDFRIIELSHLGAQFFRELGSPVPDGDSFDTLYGKAQLTRAGDQYLVGREQLLAGEGTLYHGNALALTELQQCGSRDAGENVRTVRVGYQRAVLQNVYVGMSTFGDDSVTAENCLVTAATLCLCGVKHVWQEIGGLDVAIFITFVVADNCF